MRPARELSLGLMERPLANTFVLFDSPISEGLTEIKQDLAHPWLGTQSSSLPFPFASIFAHLSGAARKNAQLAERKQDNEENEATSPLVVLVWAHRSLSIGTKRLFEPTPTGPPPPGRRSLCGKATYFSLAPASPFSRAQTQKDPFSCSFPFFGRIREK
jgi:hypothetical protein